MQFVAFYGVMIWVSENNYFGFLQLIGGQGEQPKMVSITLNPHGLYISGAEMDLIVSLSYTEYSIK